MRSVPEQRLSPEVEATAYFFVSKALANVAKHAQASSVWVAAEDGGERLTVEVGDDGVGGAAMNSGSGLRGLADRVEAVGGRFDVLNDPGAGTTLRAESRAGSRRRRRRAVPRGSGPLLTDEGFDVVGQAADADELARHQPRGGDGPTPDVAVVDIRMPPSHTTEGLVAAKTIRAEHLDVGVLVLSQYVETENANDLLADGTVWTGHPSKDRALNSTGFRGRRAACWGRAASAVDPEAVARGLVQRRARCFNLMAENLDLNREREENGFDAVSGRSKLAHRGGPSP